MLKGLSIRCFLLFFLMLIVESNSLFALSSESKPIKKITIFSKLQPVLTFTAGASISQLGNLSSLHP